MLEKRRRSFVLLCLLLALALACNTLAGATAIAPTAPGQASPIPSSPVPGGATETAGSPEGPTATPPAGVFPKPFAAYPQISVSYPASFASAYNLPVDLGAVQGVADLQLTSGQQALLSQNGFAVAAPVPGEFREFYQIYEASRYGDQLAFVTTDSVFHVYHLLFDKMLRDLERDK